MENSKVETILALKKSSDLLREKYPKYIDDLNRIEKNLEADLSPTGGGHWTAESLFNQIFRGYYFWFHDQPCCDGFFDVSHC